MRWSPWRRKIEESRNAEGVRTQHDRASNPYLLCGPARTKEGLRWIKLLNDVPRRQRERIAESRRLEIRVAIASGIDNVLGIETGI